MGTGGKTVVGIHRGQGLEREEKERTKCKEELDMKELTLTFCVQCPVSIFVYILLRSGPGPYIVTTPMTSSSNSNSNSDQPRSSKETADVSVLQEVARNSLVHALNSVSPAFNHAWCASAYLYKVNGAKTLVLDPSLAGPLTLVTEVSLLQVLTGHVSIYFFSPAAYR